MANSEFLGSCLLGEELIGIGRQIHSFENNSPIHLQNKSSAKVKSLGGKKAQCWIDKAIRMSKISEENLSAIRNKVKIFIGSGLSSGSFRIFEEYRDYIEGDELICESENCGKIKQINKLSHYSASHSADVWEFSGDCCISFVNRQFRQLKNIRLVSKQ